MARLPSGDYLIQQVGDHVIVFRDHTEAQITRFDPASTDEIRIAQAVIATSEMSDEDKAFAHFWSGYFYAHAKEASR